MVAAFTTEHQKLVEAIHLMRMTRQISQRDLAGRSGVSQARLSNFENGKDDVPLQTFLNFLTLLGLKITVAVDSNDFRRDNDGVEKAGETATDGTVDTSGADHPDSGDASFTVDTGDIAKEAG